MKTLTLIRSFIFFVTLSLHTNVQAAQPADHAEILATASPVLKKVIQVLDEKVVDSMIVTSCSGFGTVAGDYLSIKMMQNISLLTGGKGYFNVGERYEDDMGRILGTVAGYHAGQFIVYLRHKITDPLFPQLYNLGEAGFNAGKTLCENTAGWISRSTCDIAKRATNYLNAYAQKKNN